MAVITPRNDSAAFRLERRNAKMYADFTGNTNIAPNTQTLFTHGLTDDVGRGIIPTVVDVTLSSPYPAPAQPVPTTATTGGTIAAGVYTVIVTYTGANGESMGSSSNTVTTTGTTSTITVPSPAAQTGATGWYAYVSQVGATPTTRQQAAGSPTAIGTNLTLTAPPTSTGAAPPLTSDVFDVPINATTTQVDVRSNGSSMPFRARAWA